MCANGPQGMRDLRRHVENLLHSNDASSSTVVNGTSDDETGKSSAFAAAVYENDYFSSFPMELLDSDQRRRQLRHHRRHLLEPNLVVVRGSGTANANNGVDALDEFEEELNGKPKRRRGKGARGVRKTSRVTKQQKLTQSNKTTDVETNEPIASTTEKPQVIITLPAVVTAPFYEKRLSLAAQMRLLQAGDASLPSRRMQQQQQRSNRPLALISTRKEIEMHEKSNEDIDTTKATKNQMHEKKNVHD